MVLLTVGILRGDGVERVGLDGGLTLTGCVDSAC